MKIIKFPECFKKATNPCRIYVIFAEKADLAVILRRGPSAWTQQIAWNTNKDIFTYGQWIYGGLKPELADISPSGKYLLYFAQKYKSKDPAYKTFTAISEVPNFTAITLWSLGDSWYGGGRFVDEEHAWLAHPLDKQKAHREHPNNLFKLVVQASDQQFMRKNWYLIESSDLKLVLERKSKDGRYALVHTQVYGKSLDKRVNNFYLRQVESGQILDLPDIDFADFDQGGRLIMARCGQLFACDLSKDQLQAELLVDLNDQKPPNK